MTNLFLWHEGSRTTSDYAKTAMRDVSCRSIIELSSTKLIKVPSEVRSWYTAVCEKRQNRPSSSVMDIMCARNRPIFPSWGGRCDVLSAGLPFRLPVLFFANLRSIPSFLLQSSTVLIWLSSLVACYNQMSWVLLCLSPKV
jgi:hypothetical protein